MDGHFEVSPGISFVLQKQNARRTSQGRLAPLQAARLPGAAAACMVVGFLWLNTSIIRGKWNDLLERKAQGQPVLLPQGS